MLSWVDGGPVVTVVVRCDLVVCGPNVAPVWPSRRPSRPGARDGRGRGDRHRGQRLPAFRAAQDPSWLPACRAPPGRGSRPLPSSWATLARPMTWCLWVRKVGRCGWLDSGIASGGRRPERPGWMGCAFTTCGIRQWRCGLRPGTPRSASPWLAMAISVRMRIRRSGTAWTPFMRSPRHAGPHTLTDPRRTRRAARSRKAHLHRRRTGCDLAVWLVGVTGLEPVTSSL